MRTFTRTGNVLIDSLMFAAALYGCTAIRYETGIIHFVHAGNAHALPFSPKESRCTDIAAAIFQPALASGESPDHAAARLQEAA